MSQVEVNFAYRAQPRELSEWMDEPCTYSEFRDCLRELEQVNRFTFAYRPTLMWLRRLPADVPLRIVDVGCGGGDMLRRLERLARKEKRDWRLIGVDLNPHARRAAVEFTPPESRIEWITGDIYSAALAGPIDVVISSLFTHHLDDAEIVRFLAWVERTATHGWFVNDLHRERVPYHVFQALATMMRWHRFVRHDGPVSIRRAFRQSDWERYLRAAGIASGVAIIEAFRPARLCVARRKA